LDSFRIVKPYRRELHVVPAGAVATALLKSIETD